MFIFFTFIDTETRQPDHSGQQGNESDQRISGEQLAVHIAGQCRQAGFYCHTGKRSFGYSG